MAAQVYPHIIDIIVKYSKQYNTSVYQCMSE